MTLEQFKKDILGENILKFTEEEIITLYKISFSFAEFALHKFKKEKLPDTEQLEH